MPDLVRLLFTQSGDPVTSEIFPRLALLGLSQGPLTKGSPTCQIGDLSTAGTTIHRVSVSTLTKIGPVQQLPPLGRYNAVLFSLEFEISPSSSPSSFSGRKPAQTLLHPPRLIQLRFLRTLSVQALSHPNPHYIWKRRFHHIARRPQTKTNF
jgi:hypothetical protein